MTGDRDPRKYLNELHVEEPVVRAEYGTRVVYASVNRDGYFTTGNGHHIDMERVGRILTPTGWEEVDA